MPDLIFLLKNATHPDAMAFGAAMVTWNKAVSEEAQSIIVSIISKGSFARLKMNVSVNRIFFISLACIAEPNPHLHAANCLLLNAARRAVIPFSRSSVSAEGYGSLEGEP